MRFFPGFGLILCVGTMAMGQTIHGRGGITLPAPPDAQVTPVTDVYFGGKVVDDYRWLENAQSQETKDFIDAENAYTAAFMQQARIRPQIADDLDQLEHVTTWTRSSAICGRMRACCMKAAV